MAPILLLATLGALPRLSLEAPSLGVPPSRPALRLADAAPPAPPAPTGWDVIKTKDGRVRAGRILDDTGKGYLFKTAEGETLLIEFPQVDEVQRAAAPRGVQGPPAGYAVPPPGYPQYPYDPLRVERDLKRVRLEASLRDLEARYAQLSYSGAIITTAVGTAMVVLALTFLGGIDNPNGAILLVIGGIEILVGGIQLGITAWDRAELSEQIESTREEIKHLAVLPRPTLRSPMLTIARF